jgi:DNA-binding response OmpR family regulator
MARILIVDDDPDIVEAVAFHLGKAGHATSAANNRADGMRAVGTDKPDLLVLDVMMESPDDGFAMAQELRRNGWARPILMLTSMARTTGLEYGRDDEIVPVDAFLDKPCSPEVLVAKVEELLAAAKER